MSSLTLLGLVSRRTSSSSCLRLILSNVVQPTILRRSLNTSPAWMKSASFESYEKSARKEPAHFKEDQQSKALIAVAKDENSQEYLMPHPIWSDKELENVVITHRLECAKKRVGFFEHLDLEFLLASDFRRNFLYIIAQCPKWSLHKD